MGMVTAVKGEGIECDRDRGRLRDSGGEQVLRRK